MPRVLFLVSSARQMPLADGPPHPTGFFADEALTPYERFVAAGVDVVVTTPDGKPPFAEPYGLEEIFHYPDEDKDFLSSVVRTFAHNADDIRLTLYHLTELGLIGARRVFLKLRERGVPAQQARDLVNRAAKIAWRQNREFADVLVDEGRPGMDQVRADMDKGLASPLSRAGDVAGRLSQDKGLAGPPSQAEDVAGPPSQAEDVAGPPSRADVDAAIEAVLNNSRQASEAIAQKLEEISGFQCPTNLGEMSDEEMTSFDAVFAPGGHGPMVDLADNPDVTRLLGALHRKRATIASLGHGPAMLLSAPANLDGQWIFDGYRLTAFTDEEESQTPTGKLGMQWYLETALRNAGAVFDDGRSAWSPHVVVDRNLITAQNPNSADAIADAVLKSLNAL